MKGRQQESKMRELFGDFNALAEDSDLGRYIALGTESRNAELRGLEEGEHVLLKEPNELQAEAGIVGRMVRGERWWLGVLTGEIEVIYREPSTPASEE